MNTIFGRLLILAATIIVTFGFFLGTINFWLVGTFTVKQRATQLEFTADRIVELIQPSAEQEYVSVTRLTQYISILSQAMQVEILVVSADGEVILSSNTKLMRSIVDLSIFDGLNRDLVISKFIYGELCLNSCVPVIYNDAVAGYVIASAQYPAISNELSGVFRAFSTSLGISSLLGFVLSMLLSRALAGPIFELNRAAKMYAKGEFVTIKSNSKIKELQQLSSSFNHMSGSLAQTENARRDFISAVSHDLRSPLTTIGGFIDCMLDGTIEQDEYKQYLGVIKNETARMSNLVNSYLDISKYENGAYPLNITPFDINELIRKIIISYEMRLHERWLDITTDLEGELIIKADQNAIKRVICNLIENAINYADKGSTIILSTGRANKQAEFTITNNGTIEQADIPHVFDRFYRGDKSRTQSGSGLGLYIVKSILNQHNCEISLTTDTESNTVSFTFNLPI